MRADDLVHRRAHQAVRSRLDSQELDVRDHRLELLLPVIAHAVAAVDEATFRDVGPSDVVRHQRGGGADVTGVERRVGATQQLACVALGHGATRSVVELKSRQDSSSSS